MFGSKKTLLRLTVELARDLLTIFIATIAGGTRSDGRQLSDTDLIGEYNHRTGRIDAGNDPYGWYDDD